jgi:starch phosphorylase
LRVAAWSGFSSQVVGYIVSGFEVSRGNMDRERSIAYFSMEIALAPGIPTYSGGLGVLAGDTIRSAADHGVPMVAVSLIHRKGYFFQRLDAQGRQSEEPVAWTVDDFVEELPARVSVAVEGRTVQLRAWMYPVMGCAEHSVPVYLLDADLPENAPEDRTLTDHLYGGDDRYRLCQEALLGIGGVRMLRALGCDAVKRFHMNEGHSSLLAVELLEEHLRTLGRTTASAEDLEAIRRNCVFTTHTPVPAGHDKFPMDLALRVLGERRASLARDAFQCDRELNLTHLALSASHYINGVAKRHGEVSQNMFPEQRIDAITNGVHAATWMSPPFQQLFDRHVPDWREDNYGLRAALEIPRDQIWEAHCESKRELVRHVNRTANVGLDQDYLTIGFARRATAYKRPDLIFSDLERLRRIASREGPLQILYSGKAHPNDQHGKEIIQRIFAARDSLRNQVNVIYLQNYDLELGRLMTSGVDVWLNTPQPPMEASGTSGMKAALNGVPSLSVLDGWWIEGCIEGVTGWAIGPPGAGIGATDAESLYEKLAGTVCPMFYGARSRFVEVMCHAIALNGAFFNTQRMIQQYVVKAYF